MPALLPGATMIWWEVKRYTYDIKPMQVVRETEKTLRTLYSWGGREVLERTEHKTASMFRDWPTAHAAAIAEAKAAAERLEATLHEEREAIKILEKMKAPAP